MGSSSMMGLLYLQRLEEAMNRIVARLMDDKVFYEGLQVTVVSGGARGADKFGEYWANRNGMDTTGQMFYVLPSEWSDNPRMAGMNRNERMGLYGDVLVALWDGKSRGTEHMINYMKSLGKPVYVEIVDYSEPKVNNAEKSNN